MTFFTRNQVFVLASEERGVVTVRKTNGGGLIMEMSPAAAEDIAMRLIQSAQTARVPYPTKEKINEQSPIS